MLVELSVENLALLRKARLSLRPGYTVLTGETGAGKSLLLDALRLALGERADTDLVRTGAASASVQAVFDLSVRPDLLAKCEELGLAVEEGLLYVQREVAAEGRSQCRVGGRLTPVGTLRQIGGWLVDLHGQHDHQSLLQPERHASFLDAWIGDPARVALEKVAAAFRAWSAVRGQLATLQRSERDRVQRLDLLAFQLQEIDGIRPQSGEIAALEGTVKRQAHLQRLETLVSESLAILGDEEGAVRDRMGETVKLLAEGTRLDPELDEPLEMIRTAIINLEEGMVSLRRYGDGLEADPASLEATSDRLDQLRRLVRKYGEIGSAEDPLEVVLRHRDAVEAELELLSRSEERHQELDALQAQLAAEFGTACQELSLLRRERAVEFAKRVRSELGELDLGKAHFEVEFREVTASELGSDAIEFSFGANPGEAPKPLAKIASGGELSRVMLAIRAASADAGSVPTLIFDEIESGLSGRTAAVVGKKIAQLAEHAQVLTISHLPQVAGWATSHLKIEKHERDGRVITEVRPLSTNERETEVARMLAGEVISESALQNARELLRGDRAKLVA
jgi:DNA repair protein RecN (Recombination protein N)